MLKTSCISSSETPPRSWIRLEDRRHRQRRRRSRSRPRPRGAAGCRVPPEVMWARPRTSTVGAQQLDDRLDVDLGRLQQHVAERPAEALGLVERDPGQRRAGERVAVGVDPGGGQADHRRRPARTAEPSTIASRATVPKQAPETSTPRTRLAELGQLAAGDLDPGQLGAAGQADADFLADRRVGAARIGDVVEHRQRLGADADHVVDVHRHAVDPDRVEAPELLGDQQLGPDPVGRERDPGPLVELDHARVVARQRHLQRGPAELDRPQRPHQPGDGGVRRPLVDPGLGVGVARSRWRFFQALRQVGRRLEDVLAAFARAGAADPRSARPRRSERAVSWVTRWLVGVAVERVGRVGVPHRVGEQRQLAPVEAVVASQQPLDVPHLGDLSLQVDVQIRRSPARSPPAGGSGSRSCRPRRSPSP